MHELDAVVTEVRSTLLFHRRRARNHLLALVVLAFAVLLVALVFGGYLIQLLQATAAMVAAANAKGLANSPPADFTKLASEHGLGYIMVSGFVLLLFMAAGLLRHHVKRATISEDRLYHVLKVACLRSPETGLSASAQKSLLDLRENALASSADAEAHAGLAVVEKSLQSLSESVGSILKRPAKWREP